DFYRPETFRTGDIMVLNPAKAASLRGYLLIKLTDGSTRDIAVSDIREVRRAPQSPDEVRQGVTKDTLVLTDGSLVAGSVQSRLNFAGAALQNGSMVLTD